MTTEEKKHAMYYDLACLKGQKKHPILLARFESHLEEYLEAMRQDQSRGQEATAKLASQAQTIEALHRVIKSQQNAYARLQAQLKVSEEAHKLTCKNLNDKLEDGLDFLDEALARCDAKQEIIVSQRKTIETLTFELVQARKETIKSSFWQFLTRKSTQAKPLHKKTI